MKFFEKRGIALAVLVLAIAAAVFIGQSRKTGYIENQPVTLPEVQYRQWICDEAGMLSDTTKDAIRQYNDSWDSRYYAVIAVATVDDVTGWTPEEAAQKLGADWGLAANDMLLLMVRDDDYYVACGDNVLAVLNSYDTMLAKLKQAIEDPYYNGDFDGAALAFYRQADVFYGQAQLGNSGSTVDTEWTAPAAPASAGGIDVLGVILLIAAIFVVWMLLDAVRYNRYRRRYIVGAPVNVVRPVYYPIFWGRPRGPRPPRPPRGHRPPPPPRPMGGGPRPSGPRPSPRPSAPRPNNRPSGGPRPGPRPSAPRPQSRPSRPSGGSSRPSGGFGGGGFGGGSRSGGSRGGGFGKGGFGGGKR